MVIPIGLSSSAFLSTWSIAILKRQGDNMPPCRTPVLVAMNVLGKVNARTKFLARHVSFLDKQLMKLLASSLVSCHFDYACISWMSDLSRGWLDKLQKSQNKLIRLVSGFSRFTHVEVSHFKCLDWLPIKSRLEYIKLKMVHKMYHFKKP